MQVGRKKLVISNQSVASLRVVNCNHHVL